MENINNNKNKIFADNLRTIRLSKRLRQKDVADALSIPNSTYANWEQGRTEPSIQDIFNLIKFFEIEANDLFDID
ncbi:MAG: helix-turn-helix domain-containing protein [Clostridia bacterium]|nr:helix-turn-helix domain-containing protein [Clostridia bacterium]